MQQPKDVTIDLNDQGSPEWLEARCGKFTASKAGDLMTRGKNGQAYAARKNYITQLALERITGEIPEHIISEAMQEGTEREPVAALAYEFHTGNETALTGFWYKDYFGASPDRLIVGQKGGVEIKNPMAKTHYETLKSGEIPEYYYWQVLQCMLVTCADFWDFVSYHPDFPENAQLFIKRVKAEEVKENLNALKAELEVANKEATELAEFVSSYREVA